MKSRPRPFLVPLHVDQMATLLALVIREADINPAHPDAWVLERTRNSLLAGLALAERYSTPAPEEPPL